MAMIIPFPHSRPESKPFAKSLIAGTASLVQIVWVLALDVTQLFRMFISISIAE